MRSLADAYERLNEKQREAVDWPSDVAVYAGPGSGKTNTLVIKAALLRAQKIRPPRGVACITYTRASAREVTSRIAMLGVSPGHCLFTGTLHSFCLRMVLRPFARLVGEPELREPEVASSATTRSLLQDSLDRAGVSARAEYWTARLQTIRRVAASHEDLEAHFDRWEIDTVNRYEQQLAAAELVDYDAMVHHALRFVETYPRVVDLLASAFPWLLVDEYQDLGGPLHRLVCVLREQGGVRLFAVGDVDQTVMQFTGADPKYLLELEKLDCHIVRLRRNYRSGQRLITAAAAALGIDRGYEPDPDRDSDGEILADEVPNGIEGQIEHLVYGLVPRFCAEKVPLHEVAVLYRQRSAPVDLLRAALIEAQIPHSFERDQRFSTTQPIVGWLQRCAQYALGAEAEPPIRFRDLAHELRAYLLDAGRAEGSTELAAAVFLQAAIDEAPEPSDLLLDWLDYFLLELDLLAVLTDAPIYGGEADEVKALLGRLRHSAAGATVGEFAGPIRQPGRLVVTTYHSSKGRQFDIVVLPFLQERLMPVYRQNFRTGAWRPVDLKADRLLFYVAFTRARHRVALLWSVSSGIDGSGRPADFPVSPLVKEIRSVL